MDNILNFAKSIEVYSVPYIKKRVGRNQDGGYVILDEISKNTDVLYSYGISDDWSFEEEFSNKFNCISRLYDHTIEIPKIENKNLIFKKEGLSSKKTDFTDTLENHIDENLDHEKSITLKIDIEWHEWDFFENIDLKILDKIDQIICEFHVIPVEYNGSHTPYFTEFHKNIYDLMNQDIFEKYTKIIEKIKSTHILFHVHVNNSLSFMEHGKCKIPYLLECCFVNKKKSTVIDKKVDSFPVNGLDFPNKPYKPEIENFYPLFIK
jgi:hypothetical protein